MRRFWTLLLTPVLAVAFFMVGSPAANAFGAEVLGCSWNSGPWIANNCGGSDGLLTFSAHNLSGTYSYSWTLTGYPSLTIVSGCTATSSTCTVDTGDGALRDHTLTASLTLTQSGQSRTITAKATVYANGDCLTC
ncbi:MAG TPA: hypothetical protein VJ851_05460 [Jatrophihabitans sp.]|nr:hypothetical protein [Jatrophihabitans sp.]